MPVTPIHNQDDLNRQSCQHLNGLNSIPCPHPPLLFHDVLAVYVILICHDLPGISIVLVVCGVFLSIVLLPFPAVPWCPCFFNDASYPNHYHRSQMQLHDVPVAPRFQVLLTLNPYPAVVS